MKMMDGVMADLITLEEVITTQEAGVTRGKGTAMITEKEAGMIPTTMIRGNASTGGGRSTDSC